MARPNVSLNTIESVLAKNPEDSYTIEGLVNTTGFSEVTVRKSLISLLNEGKITVNTTSRPYFYHIKSQEAVVL